MAHVQGHLREAFQALVHDNPEGYNSVWQGEPMLPGRLLWSLSNCSDIMPKGCCDLLELPQGSTYSMGTGAWIALNGMPEDDRAPNELAVVPASRAVAPETVKLMQEIGHDIVGPNARLVKENAPAFRVAFRDFAGPLAKTVGGAALIVLMGLAEVNKAGNREALDEG
jgi:hypothetical protein